MPTQPPPRLHQIITTHLPALPGECVDGGGARVGQTIYAGLGSAGHRWYCLDLSLPGHHWERCADFPGPPPRCAVVIAAGDAVYVFGGFGKASPAAVTTQFDTAYRYLHASDRWEQLNTVLPVGLSGAAAIAVNASTLLFFGGYHREQFDAFHRDLETAEERDREDITVRYMSRPIARFNWNAETWALNLLTMTWHSMGIQPHHGHCKAAVVRDGANFYLLGGEVKPGLNASTIKHGRLGPAGVQWQASHAVPVNDGFGGCFGGRIGNMTVVAGGTHFAGAWERYARGDYFAHEGLRRKWLGNIFVLQDRQWNYLDSLPCPRANGISIEVGDGLVLIGGDGDEGRPCLDTLWLRDRLIMR